MRYPTLALVVLVGCGDSAGSDSVGSSSSRGSETSGSGMSSSGPTSAGSSASSNPTDASTASESGGSDSGTGGYQGPAGSLAFWVNQGPEDDYAQAVDLPQAFGSGEFTFEMWVRPDNAYPIGQGPNTEEWVDADPEPYSENRWWTRANWLLDGHNNSNIPEPMRFGTFDLVLYGGGRVRWLFNDGGGDGLIAIQAWPATEVPSVVEDGDWHLIAAVRRFTGGVDSDLELWVDGELIDVVTISSRADLRPYWDDWANFPDSMKGWFLGAEKFSATGGSYWFDYKGLIGETRFWSIARPTAALQDDWAEALIGNERGLVGWYHYGEGQGTAACDTLDANACMTLFPTVEPIWSDETPPLR